MYRRSSRTISHVPGIPVFDGHNDALTRDDHARLATGRDGGHLDLPRMRAGGIRGGIFAVFTPSADENEVPVERSDGVIEFEMAGPVEHPVAAAFAAAAAGRLAGLERAGAVVVARGVADLDAALADGAPPDDAAGPPVAVLHLEGAEAIDPGLEALPLWYAAGLRSLGPVWSRPNAFAHGVPFVFPSSPDTGPGLTDAGAALVQACASLGILVDLSHLNEAGFWDVARLGVGPLVASHSAAHALCGASRNLTDAQLDAVGESGGLVGIVFACPFLRPDFADNPDTPIALIAQHAAYIAERIGVAHVALGSDFDGATIPSAVGDAAGMPRVLDALRAVGFSATEVEAIAWRNWRRVLAAWWKE
jgi:membrane dipeptidase